MANASEAQSDSETADRQRQLQWMRQAQAGEPAGYGRLVTACQDRIYNTMLRMVGDAEEARELTQETFTRGLAGVKSFRGDSSPATWLFRIAMNLALSHLRQIQRRRVFSLDAGRIESPDQAAGLLGQMVHKGESPEQVLERRERREMTLAALGRVEPDQRAVLVLRDVEGMDYQRIAQLLNLPLGTLKSRLFRARLAMREELKEYL